jgi:hypothetical protein
MSGSSTSSARATLIYNERTKLLANAVDRASTALGVGSVFPVINLIKRDGGHLDAATTVIFMRLIRVASQGWTAGASLTSSKEARGVSV